MALSPDVGEVATFAAGEDVAEAAVEETELAGAADAKAVNRTKIEKNAAVDTNIYTTRIVWPMSQGFVHPTLIHQTRDTNRTTSQIFASTPRDYP